MCVCVCVCACVLSGFKLDRLCLFCLFVCLLLFWGVVGEGRGKAAVVDYSGTVLVQVLSDKLDQVSHCYVSTFSNAVRLSPSNFSHPHTHVYRLSVFSALMVL